MQQPNFPFQTKPDLRGRVLLGVLERHPEAAVLQREAEDERPRGFSGGLQRSADERREPESELQILLEVILMIF